MIRLSTYFKKIVPLVYMYVGASKKLWRHLGLYPMMTTVMILTEIASNRKYQNKPSAQNNIVMYYMQVYIFIENITLGRSCWMDLQFYRTYGFILLIFIVENKTFFLLNIKKYIMISPVYKKSHFWTRTPCQDSG